jgi:hypothetical protein
MFTNNSLPGSFNPKHYDALSVLNGLHAQESQKENVGTCYCEKGAGVGCPVGMGVGRGVGNGVGSGVSSG